MNYKRELAPSRVQTTLVWSKDPRSAILPRELRGTDMKELKVLSEAEILELVATASREYETYLKTPSANTEEQILPTYSTSNPVGLVVDAVLD